MAPKFIGRERELQKLKTLFNKKTASLVVVRGRRRIGKSRLVAEFAKSATSYYHFSGLAPEPGMTAQDQKNEFAVQLSRQTELPEVKLDDWTKLFMLLADKVKAGRVIILFDEITWMAHGDPTFLSKLKTVWDIYFSQNSQLILILCGSVSAWIEKNIMNSTGFLGRISMELILRELSLLHSNQLLEELGFRYSPYEKMLYLSLTGCIPWYLEQINPKASAENNIRSLCFEPNALMVTEFKRVFYDLFGKRGEIYQKIVNELAMRNLDYSEIANAIRYPKSSALTDYLLELECSGYIKKYSVWQLATGKIAKLAKYRVSDNYLRFYFRYILPKINEINKGRYVNISIPHLPGWKSILGLQFENLVLNNRDLIIQKLGINPEEIIADDPYFQRTTLQYKGCQIDYVIQTRMKTLFVCEIKFTNQLAVNQIIQTMKEKIAAFSVPRGFAVLPVLIYFGDEEEDLAMQEYFYKTIRFNEFFNP